MECNCKAEIEAKLLEQLKAKYPSAEGHKVELQGYGFAIVGNTLKMLPCMAIKGGADHYSKKSGHLRWKSEKGIMAFSFCPFCGKGVKNDEASSSS